uniref:Ribosomal protein L21 n=1 Tax=Vaginularia trichoidea TaxID=474354 RepID=A0A3G5CTA1_9MONI|nr:ribosomal protein L21 [Vaginularia trichoidea]AYW16121.1 ribosomal protein L21 [Vaginularia trichoidea]
MRVEELRVERYAIIDIEGKQLRVEPGRFYDIFCSNPKLILWETNRKLSINRVLFFRNDSYIHIGSPWLDNIRVKGHILHTCSRNNKKKILRVASYKKEMVRFIVDSITFNGKKLIPQQSLTHLK